MPALSQNLMGLHVIEFRTIHVCYAPKGALGAAGRQKQAMPNLGKFRKTE